LGGDMKKFLPVVLLLLLVPSIGWSQGNFLKVNSYGGKVEIRPSGSKSFQPLTRKVYEVRVGDEIHTGPGASVVLTLPDESYMVVNENTDLVIKDFWSGSKLRNVVNVMLGRVRFYIERVGGRPNPYRVETPTALIAVRGTTFDVAVDASGYTKVLCIDGQVGVENIAIPDREVILNKDWHTGVASGQIPLKPVVKDEELTPNRTLRVVKKGPENEGNSIDPRVLEQLVKDNDRANRPTDRFKTPASGTDSNVGRAKPGMTYPE
jgi:hypothetical protein